MSEVQRRGAHPGRHRQGLARRNRRGIAADPFGEQRREPRLLEHVEIVVRRRAIGADADVQPERQHLRHRRDAGAELQVARRIVGDAGGEFFSVRISPSSTWTQCAASTLAPNNPCFRTHGTMGMPLTRRESSTSSSVSER